PLRLLYEAHSPLRTARIDAPVPDARAASRFVRASRSTPPPEDEGEGPADPRPRGSIAGPPPRPPRTNWGSEPAATRDRCLATKRTGMPPTAQGGHWSLRTNRRAIRGIGRGTGSRQGPASCIVASARP